MRAETSEARGGRCPAEEEETHRMTPMLQMSTSNECPPFVSNKISGAM